MAGAVRKCTASDQVTLPLAHVSQNAEDDDQQDELDDQSQAAHQAPGSATIAGRSPNNESQQKIPHAPTSVVLSRNGLI